MCVRLGLSGSRGVSRWESSSVGWRGGREKGGEGHALGAVDGGLVKQGRKPEALLLKGCSGIQASYT